jgi:hypothetical protein
MGGGAAQRERLITFHLGILTTQNAHYDCYSLRIIHCYNHFPNLLL